MTDHEFKGYALVLKSGADPTTGGVAIAGFTKDDVKVRYAENTLTITGKKKDKQDSKELLHKGISEKNFTKKFELADDFVVEDAGLQDGLLCVKLKKIIPEEKREKIIDIK